MNEVEKIDKQQSYGVLPCVDTRLTSAQKRELELLQVNGGSRHVYDGRLMRVFHALQDNGLVKCESAFGQFQKGTTVSLNCCQQLNKQINGNSAK